MKSIFKSQGRAYALLFVMTLLIGGACGSANAQDGDTQAYVETLQLAMAKSEAQEWKEAAAAWQRVVEANPCERPILEFIRGRRLWKQRLPPGDPRVRESPGTWRWFSFECCLQHRLLLCLAR